MYTRHIHIHIKRERSSCLSVNGRIECLTFLNHFLSLKIDENLSSMSFCSYFLKICRENFSPLMCLKQKLKDVDICHLINGIIPSFHGPFLYYIGFFTRKMLIIWRIFHKIPSSPTICNNNVFFKNIETLQQHFESSEIISEVQMVQYFTVAKDLKGED